MFAAMSNVGGWAMGYFDGSQLRVWQWAKDYVLADNFFMGAFGGSYLNHQWLICACTPVHRDAPDAMRVRLDSDGKLTKQVDSPSAKDGTVKVISGGGGQVTPDSYSVNTSQPPYQPSGISPAPDGNPDFANPAVSEQGQQVVPPQTQKTIGDTLTAKNIPWAWYAGGFNLGLADGRQASTEKRKVIYSGDEGGLYFIPHHQPFNYHARFAPGTPDRSEHLKDGDDFVRDIDAGTLPQVAFYKPVGRFTQHPSYSCRKMLTMAGVPHTFPVFFSPRLRSRKSRARSFPPKPNAIANPNMKAPKIMEKAAITVCRATPTCSKAIEIAKAQITNRMDQLSSFGDG